MATQQIRNIVNSQIDALVNRAEREVRNEGKKKLLELKKQIPTKEELAKKLQSYINDEACSDKGNEKFMKIYNRIDGQLSRLEVILNKSITKMEKITGKLELITKEQGPIGKINGVIDLLSPILETLKYVIALAPILLAANSGPTSSGLVTDQVGEGKRMAKGKIKEFAALFATIPLMFKTYIDKAISINDKIIEIKDKISTVRDEIVKNRAYIYSILLQREESCSNLIESQTQTDTDNTIDPGNTNLEEYMALLKNQYEDVYNQLQEGGHTKALERVYTLRENFDEYYDEGFRVINPQNNPEN